MNEAQFHEPGCSLRAEIRRLRRCTLDAVAKIDTLLDVCGFDNEIVERLALLGKSLQQHRELDAVNGVHYHYHARALQRASRFMNDKRIQEMQWIKKQGDNARHVAFHAGPVASFDAFDMLKGMASFQRPTCGAVVLAGSSHQPDWIGDSLSNLLKAKTEKTQKLIQHVCAACRASTLESYQQVNIEFEINEWVVHCKRVVSIMRVGNGLYAGEVRVARPDEDIHQWSTGMWVPMASITSLRFPIRFRTLRTFQSADDPPIRIQQGALGMMWNFDKEGDMIVQMDGHSRRSFIYVEDLAHFEVG